MPLGRSVFQKHNPPVQQNYQALLETCLKSKCLFTDENFPAHISSIGMGALLKKLPPKLQWKRPHDLPFFCYCLKRKPTSTVFVHLFGAGNCWFLAALEALTFHQDILAAVVPQNQSFDRKYAGIFHFRFWHFGKWVDVVVDDLLPVNEAGELVFVSSVYKNVFWGALLEKAYAKLYGSYEDLQIGRVSEALVDFTGGVNVTIKLAAAPPDLWDIMTRATYSRSLMGCQTHSGVRLMTSNGLTVTCHYGPENLVRLRNPWGKIEWKGDWKQFLEQLLPAATSAEKSTASGQAVSLLSVISTHAFCPFVQLVWSMAFFVCLYFFPQQFQESNRKLPPAFFSQHQPVNNHRLFVDEREVSLDFHLEPGVYVIVPCTLEPHQESEFILRVFSRKHRVKKFMEALGPECSQMRGNFVSLRFSEGCQMIPANNLSSSSSSFFFFFFFFLPDFQSFHLRFSLDACQGILALLDLGVVLLFCVSFFFFPLPFSEGISLSNEVCNLMAIRYGNPDLQISFESFVCFMLRVEIMGGEAGAGLPCDTQPFHISSSWQWQGLNRKFEFLLR
uniref:Calpain 14 n=1 Tax=Nothoprocta perdicaria TaxID=30464 RepID=A0A8C7E9Y2_NOTPE